MYIYYIDIDYCEYECVYNNIIARRIVSRNKNCSIFNTKFKKKNYSNNY